MNKLFLFFLLFISCCTITNEIHFNNDFSGTFRADFIMPKLKLKDSSEQKFNIWRDSVRKEMKESDTMGITNFQIGWIENTKTIYYSFDFKNLDGLNNNYRGFLEYINRQYSSPYDSTLTFFYKKGKNKLIFEGPSDTSKYTKDNAFTKSLKKELTYKLVFSFDNEIRKVNYPGFKISYNRKKAEIKGSLFDENVPYFNKIIFTLK